MTNKNPKSIKEIEYSNAHVYKMKNKRVCVTTLPKDGFSIQFKALAEDVSPRVIHLVERGKIVITALALTEESALCLMKGLYEELKKKGIVDLNLRYEL